MSPKSCIEGESRKKNVPKSLEGGKDFPFCPHLCCLSVACSHFLLPGRPEWSSSYRRIIRSEPNHKVKTNPPFNSSSCHHDQNGLPGKEKSLESNICTSQGQVQPTEAKPLDVALGRDAQEPVTQLSRRGDVGHTGNLKHIVI